MKWGNLGNRMKAVFISLLVGTSIQFCVAQDIACLKSMRNGVFNYEGTDVKITRNDSINIEVFNNGNSSDIEYIKWLNDSIYILTQKELINTPTTCLGVGDKIWITIIECENNKYHYKWKTDSCGSGNGNYAIVKLE